MRYSVITILCMTLTLFAGLTTQVSAREALDRTVLPIQEPERPTYSELDVRNVETPPLFEVKAPKKAPNIVIVLIDDIGFGGPSTFGGPIQTPTLDMLAAQGITYNNFHTTALCSPTRNALKTGRNHHTANTGSIMESSTGFPGNTGQVPNSVAPLAEMLRLNGYSTGAFGKWHETAAWETSVSGPFDRWPTHQGFDKFYGFIGGETDQWYPLIYDGVIKVTPPKTENYHFTVDMTNQAIQWVKAQQSMTPDKPFLIYFATGAVHAPHHVPKEWIKKYKGKFDEGWDKIREKTMARQKKMGMIPSNTKLPPKPKDIKDWDDLTDDEKRLFTRQAEVFAGFLEQTDHEVGRLIAAIEEIDEMDNTLIFYIAGDNGTSAEGGFVGMYNEMTYFNNVTEKVEDLLPLIDEWGGPQTFPHMAAGWAVAFDSPFMWTKQVASDFGGTRNGMTVHWPNGIKEKGGLRRQFSHVIDIAPTILEAAGLPEPKSVNGTPQTPMEGTSMLYSFNDAGAKERHTTQYFEMFGNRAIYHEGWFARTIHRAPWMAVDMPPLESDTWELFNVQRDFSLAKNLADKYPKKVVELEALFMKEAEKYNALPIDDRVIERMNPAIAGRPDILGDRTTLTLYPGMDGMLENTFMNVKNRSKTITAKVAIPKGGANGVILAQGGRFGGWSLYMKDGKPIYTYNFLGLERYTVESKKTIPEGEATILLDFVYDGGGLGKGGKATLSVNGKAVANGRIEKTQPLIFSADETADVGLDNQTPVAEDIGIGREETRFTGEIHKITLAVKDVK
ncbi:arylsulfatase [Desulfoluna spongiiphila]|uniref:arylsulfatase n=1 Tax=Desulfoluna spongiiphila TaxID=419481 RepID=UPI00125322E7|nr:arylsulfatase [Desulfoluna spongiiphila]VVS94176.1 alkaline phosphatase-like alpha/beta/alpha [Desulfoluna spongiiphila]